MPFDLPVENVMHQDPQITTIPTATTTTTSTSTTTTTTTTTTTIFMMKLPQDFSLEIGIVRNVRNKISLHVFIVDSVISRKKPIITILKEIGIVLIVMTLFLLLVLIVGNVILQSHKNLFVIVTTTITTITALI